ncbi:TPA: helix-turn-helix transcriptional regulator [Clostridioides difficile]|nr:XRE family transcriptional regulator [Clostridioides difficile]MDW0007383.1 helix-turn-helix transcriptional regulator [Clostridioides difficile]HBG7720994.1 helix-turn-helix transcriptional regulator [Clostridioides difficile]HBH1340217.1 helix-turn-helix transcriptional regulator [Clostridioides difficile]HEK4595978.1 helix-turn-helix transcriptional regulator [Clostridioides difficile]
MHERIYKIRTSLKMSQREFGEKLGVSRDVISNIEYNRVTPKPVFIQHLCELYNVNKEWLLTGEGEMFIEFSENEKVLKIATDIINEDDKFMKNILFTFSNLNDEQKEFLTNLMKNMTQ